MKLFKEKKSSELPRVFYPRLGQISLGEHGKVIDKTLPGFLQSQSEAEQVKELRRMLDSVLKRSRVDKKKRVHLVVVDEVRHGGSVSQAVEMIEGLIASKATKIPVSISVVAIAEDIAYRSASYNALKSRINVKEFLVPRVFTMDSATSLFPTISPWLKSFFSLPLAFCAETSKWSETIEVVICFFKKIKSSSS